MTSFRGADLWLAHTFATWHRQSCLCVCCLECTGRIACATGSAQFALAFEPECAAGRIAFQADSNVVGAAGVVKRDGAHVCTLIFDGVRRVGSASADARALIATATRGNRSARAAQYG